MPRTLQQYLDDHSGDATRALEAAVADVAQREGENAAARSFRRHFEPVLQELQIPTTQDGADRLRESLTASAQAESLAALVSDMTEVFTEMGINFDGPDEALNAALEALPQRWKDAQSASIELATLKQEKETASIADVAKAKPGVLTERLTLSNLTAKVQGEAPKAGEEDKRTVRLIDKEGKDVGELKEYAAQHWPDYVPALFPVAPAGQGSGPVQSSGTVITAQTGPSTQSPAPANAFSSILQNRQPAQGQTVVSAFNFTPQGANK